MSERRYNIRASREIDRYAFEHAITGPGYDPRTWVYFIQMPTAKHVKIGFAKNVKSRLATIQNGNPERLTLLCRVRGDAMMERLLHTYFRQYRLEGEWFRWNPLLDEAVNHITRRRRLPFHFWLLTQLRAQEALHS